MTTTNQDHQASDEQRHLRPANDQQFLALRRGTSVQRCGLAFVALALLASLSSNAQTALSPLPGTLANPGFERQPMKGVYFFAGDWRRGRTFYEGPTPGELLTPSSNDCVYTIFPSDGNTHLGWSERQDKRDHAVDLMLAAGVNVVNMSYWGPPSTDRWAFWAPMQTATGAHDELFDAAVGKPLLIAPAIESSATTIGARREGCHGSLGPIGRSPGFDFLDVFPGTPDNPAPELVEQIVDLVDRYLLHPANPAWPEKWVQMYDRHGQARYVVSLIHVGSNQPGVTDDTFAEGFTRVADRVYRETGILVGFTLDALPPEHNAVFTPSPEKTGPALALQPAVLAIQPFNPEVYTGRCAVGEDCDAVPGSPQLAELIEWKRRFVSGWVSTRIPVILDVTPGYDAHRVFPGATQYGNNPAWRNGQAELLALDVRGLTANTWNGYTEGYAIVPSCRSTATPPGLPLCGDGTIGADAAYRWFRALTPPGGGSARLPTRLIGTSQSSGVYSDAITLTFRLASFNLDQALFALPVPTPVADKAVHIRLGDQEAQATTNEDGVATINITIGERPGDVPLVASFEGDTGFLSIEARNTVRVAKEATNVQWLGAAGSADSASAGATLTARLTDDDGHPVSGRTIVFTVDPAPNARTCSGVTNVDGVARCSVGVPPSTGDRTVRIDFGGDSYYEPATAQQQVNLNPK